MLQFGSNCFRCVGGKFECDQCGVSCIKHGRDARGKQRYICKKCRRTSVMCYIYQAYALSVSNNIVQLCCEGSGIRSIARLLSISPTTVIKRILAIASKIQKPPIRMRSEFEMDELCTFAKRKSKLLWLAYAIDKQTKQVAAFNIGPRDNKTLKSIVRTILLSDPLKISTDGLANYRYLIPSDIHLTNAFGTNHIERLNLNIRTHLKRFQRRGISFSKSISLMCAVLKIYFWRNYILY